MEKLLKDHHPALNQYYQKENNEAMRNSAVAEGKLESASKMERKNSMTANMMLPEGNPAYTKIQREGKNHNVNTNQNQNAVQNPNPNAAIGPQPYGPTYEMYYKQYQQYQQQLAAGQHNGQQQQYA